MNPVRFIREKREGLKHRKEDLEAFLQAYLREEVPDYQVAAWLMAAFLRGLDQEETLWLTEVMAYSGRVLDLSGLPHPVDKHSSGGVGDKVSLLVGPILAASGCTFAKMSGRGLAHTGGTIDKLESVPGWRGEMTEAEFLERARRVGLVIAAQSPDLAPLDGKLYALRDVTATVESLPLIASSIMSKKLAAGARSIVLDVKVGKGAFMKTIEEARLLAQTMVEIGRGAGRRVRALLTSMEAPLGRAVGNALEVREAILALKGEGPGDLLEVALRLAEEALSLEGLDPAAAQRALETGAALEKFRAFLEAQGGDGRVVEDLGLLPLGEELSFRAEAEGVVQEVDAYRVGLAVLALGGGRRKKGEAIDPGVGVYLLKKPGDRVARGEALALLYHRGRGLEEALAELKAAFRLGEEARPLPLVLERVG
ncbi:MAG: thymidine phosphorylase [Thermus sp.]|uniref:thymidine phosphorylase n=1 Tax=Thermus sp. TaxID=275 RepID=UPI0025DD378D|nr:thymidine phosphorylase [Thermus sp.]MCS6869104.1 thymidine phosphorylase [Thermus sp.]MCS7217828.1 thymidine phosphorylase [Thermus sp.]MCX7849617.1 thymidine phosphorylase [Thermus sp.]MDW8016646.1 thymidine phosphorylase [Thermus sp.]MDW8356545.1 thymidine phosphorylase [Thermus sp.]